MTLEEMKEEVLRAFVLSQCIEPLADKPGCTTRTVDSSPGTKLEYFLVSAVNSAWPILTLVDRIAQQQGQPACVFDIAYEAQLRSVRNRHGGKVNYAQILMLLPIITAQCLLFVEGDSPRDTDRVLNRVGDAMRSTTPRDVEYLQKFVDLSRELSEKHHQRLGTARAQLFPKFQGVFSSIMDAAEAKDFSHTTMAIEIRQGYPKCREILEALRRHPPVGIIKHSERIYKTLLPQYGRHDVAADFISTAFYLIIFESHSAILFP
ncbi:MAG: hypothetical protein ACRDQZ_00375 [Mycobacteriales bacterium]